MSSSRRPLPQARLTRPNSGPSLHFFITPLFVSSVINCYEFAWSSSTSICDTCNVSSHSVELHFFYFIYFYKITRRVDSHAMSISSQSSSCYHCSVSSLRHSGEAFEPPIELRRITARRCLRQTERPFNCI